MSNPEYYKYYKTTPETKAALEVEFDATAGKERKRIVDSLRSETDCIGYTLVGHSIKKISTLVYPKDHPILKESYIKNLGEADSLGDIVVKVKGRNNFKKGKALNQVMLKYSGLLNTTPDYSTWLVDRLQIKYETWVSTATSMIELKSKAGNAQGLVLAMIPDLAFGFDLEGQDGRVITLPECLTEITYGEFYDLAKG